MLTNLDWLNKGQPYPPANEKERIDQYKVNEQLFLTKHAEVWKSDFEKIAARLRKKKYDVETVFNYQQLLSKKTADFVCGEPPTIETAADTDALVKKLDDWGFFTLLYEAIIDVSRYGNAVQKIVGKRLTAVNPAHWFPIVDPADLKHITQHVIAYPTAPDKENKMTQLYVEIHDIGRVEVRFYKFDSDFSEIGALIEQPASDTGEIPQRDTGLDDFAVRVLTNITHSGSVFGIDDYSVVNSVIAKIMWRLHCADRVLDKHSEPSVSGPQSALEFDERTGMYFLNLGNYFKRNTNEDPDLKYITWDGNLDSNFREIEMLFNQLYTLSELGQAFSEAAGGTADSGEALKLRMVSPRIKAARLVNINKGSVKKLITMLAQINGIAIDYDGLTIHWNDGLPDDEKEQAETLTVATGGKAIMSQYAAMKRMGLSDEEADAELEQMDVERSAAAPVLLSAFDSPFKQQPAPVKAVDPDVVEQ